MFLYMYKVIGTASEWGNMQFDVALMFIALSSRFHFVWPAWYSGASNPAFLLG